MPARLSGLVRLVESSERMNARVVTSNTADGLATVEGRVCSNDSGIQLSTIVSVCSIISRQRVTRGQNAERVSRHERNDEDDSFPFERDDSIARCE